jgi:hypothetical protein
MIEKSKKFYTRIKAKKMIVEICADCQDCGKRWEDYTTTKERGAAHASNTGHRVIVEATYLFTYNSL